MHAGSENVRNPFDTAALPPLLSARHSPERAPFLSFWPVSPEMRDGAVNQTCPDFDMETSGSPNEIRTDDLLVNSRRPTVVVT